MAIPYTGTEVTPTAITLPDDGDTPSAAAWTVALEALKDFINFLYAKQLGTRVYGDDFGTKGTIIDTITGATAETVQLSGADVKVETADLRAGDTVFVIATLNAYSDTEVADVRLRVTEETSPTAIVQTQVLPAAGSLVTVTLQGLYTMTAAGTLAITIEGVNSATPNNLYVYGGLNISAVVVRP